MGSATRGNAAEAAVLNALARRDLDAFVPFGSGHDGPKPYAGFVDLSGVWFPPTDQVFLAPIDTVAATEGRLRFEPPRNNQRKRIRMAADFEVAAWSDERLPGLAAAARAPAA